MYTPQQVEAVLAAARDVIANEDNTGCSDDLTVTSLSACERLQEAVQALQPHALAIGMHTHGQGVSLYPYLVPAGRELFQDEFIAFLGETFEEHREEFAEVITFPDGEVEVLTAESLPSNSEGAAGPAPEPDVKYIDEPVGKVLLPNGRVVPIDSDDHIETQVTATIYELVEQGRDAVDAFLSAKATGVEGDTPMLDMMGYYVEGRTASGELLVTVTGMLQRDVAPDGHSFEPLCKKCGSALQHEGYCTDATCAYSDWPQNVPYDELTTVARHLIEARHNITKRSRAND